MNAHAAVGGSVRLPSLALGGTRFDASMLYAFPIIAFMTTAVVLVRPELFWPVLAADLWLLGYHHVIATYTRTAMDRLMIRRYWKLNFALPVLVFAGVSGIALGGGAIALTTIYIHWQLFHYVRQSEGISKGFASRQPGRALPNNLRIRCAFYLLPLVSFLTMSHYSNGLFLNFPVWLPVLPKELLVILWMVTSASLLIAAKELAGAIRRGEVSRQYLHYYISHMAVFGIAYGVIADVNLSWLMANIWHNAQYIAFVWKANQGRFKSGFDKTAPVLSSITQPGKLWLYLAVTMTLTLLIYSGATYGESVMVRWTGFEHIAVAAIIYQTINFHHYIVDAIIWRRGKTSA